MALRSLISLSMAGLTPVDGEAMLVVCGFKPFKYQGHNTRSSALKVASLSLELGWAKTVDRRCVRTYEHCSGLAIVLLSFALRRGTPPPSTTLPHSSLCASALQAGEARARCVSFYIISKVLQYCKRPSGARALPYSGS